MSQPAENYVIGNQNGASLRQDLNSVIQAILSCSIDPTEPPETYPLMWWGDSTAGIMKQRNAADTAWISRFAFDATLLSAGNNLSELTDKPAAFSAIKQPASTTTTGVVEKATPTEMTNGTAEKYPDAALVKSYVDTVYAGVKLPISGLVVTNNVTDLEHDIDISAGSVDGEVLASGITKRLDTTFAEGDGNGGMIGTLPTSGVVYIFLIRKDSDGTLDVYAETTEGTSPPSGWSVVKRIFTVPTDASANLMRFIVSGNGERLTVYPYQYSNDWDVFTVSTSRVSYPISGVLKCPPNVDAEIQLKVISSSNTNILLSSTYSADTAPTDSLSTISTSAAASRGQNTLTVKVNSNRQVALRRGDSDVSDRCTGGINCWIEDRS